MALHGSRVVQQEYKLAFVWEGAYGRQQHEYTAVTASATTLPPIFGLVLFNQSLWLSQGFLQVACQAEYELQQKVQDTKKL